MGKKDTKVTKKEYNSILLFIVLFFTLILIIVVGMDIKNSINLRSILTESVKTQLISTSMAAKEMIDLDEFVQYEDESVAMQPSYQVTLHKLRSLADAVGAEYIYALKRQGDRYVFVFDTDREDPSIFIPYDLSKVHEDAFAGQKAADVMNVDDKYGSFNTGAVPIIQYGQVVGVVATDMQDAFIESSYTTALVNSLVLIGVLILTMGFMFYLVIKLLRRIKSMQGKLEQQALYDTVTGLPNRQYLMDHLARLTASPDREPFGLLFIDLDNFKTVNDSAGHDAGDDVLRRIAGYLDTATANAKSFRPSAGRVNIAARVGGDEFIQVVTGIDSDEKLAEVAEQLLTGFKNANLGRYIEKYNVGLSIGAAAFPHDTDDFNVLIKYADIAMYHAKHGGKNQYRVYVDEMGQEK